MDNLLSLNTNIMFWTWVTFLVLIVVLGKFGWKPIINALDARISKIKEDIDHAEKNRVSSEKLIADQKELISKAHSQSEEILAKAKKEATDAKNEIVEKARNEAQDIADKAKEEVNLAKSRALDELKSEVGKISVDIAGKIISKSLTAKDHDKLISDSLSQYQNSKG